MTTTKPMYKVVHCRAKREYTWGTGMTKEQALKLVNKLNARDTGKTHFEVRAS